MEITDSSTLLVIFNHSFTLCISRIFSSRKHYMQSVLIVALLFEIVRTENIMEALEKATKEEGEEEEKDEENAPLDNEFDDQPPESNYDDTTDENENEDLEWISVAVRDIGFYLRSHKFNDFDRRYHKHGKEIVKEFVANFPIPPLRSLHWEVRNHCDKGFKSCIMYLQEKALLAELRRTEDATTIIRAQKLDQKKNETAIKTINDECLKKYNLDYVGGLPFGGPLERFQWRSTASYYMCWFTMKEVNDLVMFGEPCDNFARCLDPDTGLHNGDVRARDKDPFACATYSFCPDPCCPVRVLRDREACLNTSESPCFDSAPAERRHCALNYSLNTDFVALVLNQWNTSCNCSRDGFAWESRFRTCVDVDECARGTHACDKLTESCFNLPGRYTCACSWGYLFDAEKNKCQPSKDLGQGWAPEPEEIGKMKGVLLYFQRVKYRIIDFYENVMVYFGQSALVNRKNVSEVLLFPVACVCAWKMILIL